MTLFSSFVFCETTLKQINDLPENLRLKFYEAVTNYGIYNIDPQFTGLENTIWISMKDIIDTTKAKRERKQKAGKAGGEASGETRRNRTRNKRAKQREASGINAKQVEATRSKLKQREANGNGNGNLNVNVNDNGNGNPKKTTVKKPPPFFIKTIQEESERLGLVLDSKLVSKIDPSGIDPAWLTGPFNFLQFAYEQLTTNPNYRDKQAKDYELLLAASFSWEDFQKKYPIWKQAREKAEAEREEKHAREEARKKALERKPRTCPKCRTKLDNNLICPTCEGYYPFVEEKLEYIFFPKTEKNMMKEFKERLKQKGENK
jgi:hypothetical protein